MHGFDHAIQVGKQSWQTMLLASNVETTKKVDASLVVITETVSRITSMNDHVARLTGNQKNVAIIISHHVEKIHNHTEAAAASS